MAMRLADKIVIVAASNIPCQLGSFCQRSSIIGITIVAPSAAAIRPRRWITGRISGMACCYTRGGDEKPPMAWPRGLIGAGKPASFTGP